MTNNKGFPFPNTNATPPKRKKSGYEAAVFCVFVLASLAIAIEGILLSPAYSLEALQRSMGAEDLLAGLSRGRQALVGSLWFPPLPTVVLAIGASFPLISVEKATCVLIAAAAGLLLCRCLNGLWREEGINPLVRAAGGVAILLLPAVFISIRTGQSTALYLASVAGGMCFLVKWLSTAQLRALAYAGLLLSLSPIIRFQGIFIASGAALIVFIAILLKKPEKGLMEGSALIFATPIVYMLLLWLGGNWLILGNPFFPFRGLLRFFRIEQQGLAGQVLGDSREWITLALVTLIATAPVLHGFIHKKAGTALKTCTFALIIAGATAFAHFSLKPPEVERPDEELAQIMSELEDRHDNTSFIVTGYEGYEFTAHAGTDIENVWVHVMHLESAKLEKILEDFRGRQIYLIVNAKDNTSGWINLGFEWVQPRIQMVEQLLFVERIDQWIVFEVFCPETNSFQKRT